MNHSELEKRLKADAEALDLRCPDTVRQRVVRRLRTGPSPWRRRQVLVPLAAAAAGAVAAVGLVLMLPESAPERAGPVARVVSRPVPQLDLDRALAGREAELAMEMERIESDLKRIRALVTDV